MMEDTRRRTVELRVKLSPALAQEFFSLAEARGLLPVQYAAGVLGEHVAETLRRYSMQQAGLNDLLTREFDEDRIGKAMAAQLNEALKAEIKAAAARSSPAPEGV